MTTLDSVVHVDAIDAAWLTRVLSDGGRLDGATVVQVRREPCGTGQLGDSYRFALTYDRPSAGPATVVGKFPSDDATSREYGRRTGYYRSEIRFYNELAAGLPVSIPTAIHAALADNEADFVLLMDDLAPARSVDQLVGLTADDAALVMEEMAKLHAARWRDPVLSGLGWLDGPSNVFHHVTENFAAVIAAFPELCGDLVADSDLEIAAAMIPYAAAWRRLLDDPQCLWHSDIRADNVLFDAQDGTRPVVLLDWQGLGFGRGTLDVGLFLGTSLDIELRREHERDLVALYHGVLSAGGVDEYDSRSCWDLYRMQAVHGLQVGVFGLGAVKRTARGDEMWRSWIERTAAQVRDLDSYALLAER